MQFIMIIIIIKNDRNSWVLAWRCSPDVVLQEAALRAFYLPDDPQDFELKEVSYTHRLHSDDILNRNGGTDNRGGSLKDGGDAWLLRAKPRDPEVIKVYMARPRWEQALRVAQT